ncbi:MAG: molecular chaperone HtpG, partial [Magnetococcales bacterium]|nr:molecular chaperone HtpG [Magnetococcales bacterium]
PEDQGVRWQSRGDGEYTVETIHRPARGTDIILHLREGEDEFLDDWRLRSVVRKFSDHVPWPILMLATSQESDPDKKQSEERKWETVNKASALWMRSRSEIEEQEYHDFYKHIAHDFEAPMAYLHARLEGKYEYTLLLYIPGRAPFDIWDRDRKQGLKLYVKRVFIMDTAEQLMPRYLRFVRGLVDSADLPLNISREILQHNKVAEAIRKGTVNKILGLLEEMASNDSEKYALFWKTYGVVMKEGTIEDHGNRERLAKLYRFASTHSNTPDQTHSLADYVSRMKPGQQHIYYLNGDGFAAVKGSPHLEIFRRKDVEVLLMYDRIDEWMASQLHDFDGKELHSVAKGNVDLSWLADEEEKKVQEEQAEQAKPLLDRITAVLGSAVSSVRISQRLTDSPACLIGDEYGMSMSIEKLLREAGQDAPVSKRVLEVNPNHPLVQRMQGESNEQRFSDWCWVLFDQAVLSESGQLSEPAAFVRRINELLTNLASGC